MREKSYFEQNRTTKAIDFSSYRLNLNQNSHIYEEQQMAASALNASRRQADQRPWFIKK